MRIATSLSLTCAILSIAPNSTFACVTLMGKTGSEIVPVLEEKVLITWEPATSTEHFVRRIAFDTAAQDIGFLVPLPSAPEIAEADSKVFDRLEQKAAPAKITLPRPASIIAWILDSVWHRLGQMITGAASEMSSDSRQEHSVRVISTTQVAGQTAVVLEADDAGALSSWLQLNRFVTRPDLAPWLQKYIDARWKIVAFKFDPRNHTPQQFSTTAVRLSFKTTRPFFPYREPSDQWATAAVAGRARLLKVFFAGPTRVVGSIGEQSSWPGTAVYSFPTFSTGKLLAGAVPTESPSRFSWLTIFEDRSSPRPASDELYFETRHAYLPLISAPTIEWFTIPIPIEFILIAFTFYYIPKPRS